MSYESVCRTAPAPPGLLTTCVPSGFTDYQCQCALGYRQVSNSCGQSHPVCWMIYMPGAIPYAASYKLTVQGLAPSLFGSEAELVLSR